jgi:redox-sensitive bicupin YhaK (pirin superfamily)
MATPRDVIETRSGKPTIEGAGVRLSRVFGRADERLDPFLLLDAFGSDDPADYVAGFPWHPHRGIETVTYMLDGRVEHQDSIGNSGVIGPSDVQWMTAGGGILHQEMPLRSERLRGFQLWVNLSAASKMTPPRYRGLTAAEIPTVDLGEGISAKAVAGQVRGVAGPVSDLSVDVTYLDFAMPGGRRLETPIAPEHNAFAYVFDGAARFGGSAAQEIAAGQLAVLGAGDGVTVVTGPSNVRFLLVSGQPLREPVAWGGPIVMNTQEELRRAFEELRAGTFVR